MKHFKTIIITKKHLKKILLISVFGATVFGCAFGTVHFLRYPSATMVFSEIDIAQEILDEGLPTNKQQKSVKSIVTDILGFDIDKPETILSHAFPTETETTVSIPPDELSVSTENVYVPTPSPYIDAPPDLPTHEQIISVKKFDMSNATTYSPNLTELCSSPLSVSVKGDSPQVLIMHTHTTECFVGDEMAGESERTTNEQYNMCAVGDVIQNVLESYGIGVIHDKTIHDYPSYKGSYTRAMETIEKNLAAYPSIQIVLDVHRDAYIYNDGSKLRVSADINGQQAARVMLVMGTDSMGLYHPYWKENLKLALKTQSAADIMYPGLMRSINLRRERFNMHATKGSLLLEVGSNGNTLAEAKLGGEYVARALAAALLNG